MQAVESQTLILYQTDLRGQWPEAPARAFSARLPYARRLALGSGSPASRASLAGIALALRALARLLGRRVLLSEILFAPGAKPRLAPPAALAAGEAQCAQRGVTSHDERAVPDFSISHAGPCVGCARCRSSPCTRAVYASAVSRGACIASAALTVLWRASSAAARSLRWRATR